MKRIIIILAYIIFSKPISAQQTEKFMQLQRIVILDSTKEFSTSLPVMNGRNIYNYFNILVPNGVIWKITQVLFWASPLVNNYNYGGASYLQINDIHMSALVDEFIPTQIASQAMTQSGSYDGFNIRKPIWVKGNSKIRLWSGSAYTGGWGGTPFKLYLYLVAEEYLIT